jgi:hypothetical protein
MTPVHTDTETILLLFALTHLPLTSLACMNRVRSTQAERDAQKEREKQKRERSEGRRRRRKRRGEVREEQP